MIPEQLKPKEQNPLAKKFDTIARQLKETGQFSIDFTPTEFASLLESYLRVAHPELQWKTIRADIAKHKAEIQAHVIFDERTYGKFAGTTHVDSDIALSFKSTRAHILSSIEAEETIGVLEAVGFSEWSTSEIFEDPDFIVRLIVSDELQKRNSPLMKKQLLDIAFTDKDFLHIASFYPQPNPYNHQ